MPLIALEDPQVPYVSHELPHFIATNSLVFLFTGRILNNACGIFPPVSSLTISGIVSCYKKYFFPFHYFNTKDHYHPFKRKNQYQNGTRCVVGALPGSWEHTVKRIVFPFSGRSTGGWKMESLK